MLRFICAVIQISREGKKKYNVLLVFNNINLFVIVYLFLSYLGVVDTHPLHDV